MLSVELREKKVKRGSNDDAETSWLSEQHARTELLLQTGETSTCHDSVRLVADRCLIASSIIYLFTFDRILVAKLLHGSHITHTTPTAFYGSVVRKPACNGCSPDSMPHSPPDQDDAFTRYKEQIYQHHRDNVQSREVFDDQPDLKARKADFGAAFDNLLGPFAMELQQCADAWDAAKNPLNRQAHSSMTDLSLEPALRVRKQPCETLTQLSEYSSGPSRLPSRT